MTCPAPQPTRAGFIQYIRDNVGIPAEALPDNSPTITYALCAARDFVDNGMGLKTKPLIYTRTLYNMATSMLLNYGEDQPGSKFFANMRKTLGLNNLHAGIMTSAADQGTSGSIVVSKAMQNLSLADLQLLQDPYGRQVAAVLMEMGPLWGYTP